jgi:hypothetical protein
MLVVKERVSFAQGKNKSQILTTGLISERLINRRSVSSDVRFMNARRSNLDHRSQDSSSVEP